MLVVKLLVVLLMLGSIVFAVVVQIRLLNYAKKHQLPESKYTWLFGFIKLGYVNTLYVLSVLTQAVLFTWLTFYYL
ncbi:MAG: hypothetical protein WC604_04325 [Candidatus Gracilibacteria bacterium]